MAIHLREWRRIWIVASVVVLAAIVVAVNSLTSRPGPTTSALPNPTASPLSSPSSEPLPTPLAAASAPLPRCDAGLQPQRGVPGAVEPAVAGPVSLTITGQLGGAARTALLEGHRLYVGAAAQVLEVDLSDPQRPREIASSRPLGGIVEGLTRADESIVVAAGDAGLTVLDVGAGLAVRSSIALPGRASAVAAAGDLAYVADDDGGLRIVLLRDPASPAEMGHLLDLHRILDVAVAGSVAYLAAADEGLLVVDVADPAHPAQIGTLFTGGYAFGVGIEDGRVLLADGWEGLQVIDVADPRQPRLIANLPADAWTMDVAIDGGRAYVADGADGLRILDLGNRDHPEAVGTIPTVGGHGIAVTADGGQAAIVDTAAGVRILDVAGARPIELATYGPLAAADGLALAGMRAFIAAKGQGLRVVDVSDPGHPTDAGGIATEDPVRGAAVVGSNLFFTTWPRPGPAVPSSIYGLDLNVPDRLEVAGSSVYPGNNTAIAVDARCSSARPRAGCRSSTAVSPYRASWPTWRRARKDS